MEVYGPPERPVLLGAYDHAMAPSDGRAQGDLLQHAKADVPVEASLHLFPPVDRDVDRGVAWFGDGVGVNVELEWWSRHHWERLVLADVERTCCVEVEQVTFLFSSVAGNGRDVGRGGGGARSGQEHDLWGMSGNGWLTIWLLRRHGG